MERIGNTHEPLVSVIVPCHNYGRYLAECLASILGQTHRNVELIVVDDGSTDESAAVAEGIAAGDARVRVIRQANGGISKARNTGIAAATGTYIGFIDADDYWPHADQLQRQVSFLEENRDFGWIFGDAQPFREKDYTGPGYLRASGYYAEESTQPRRFPLTAALLCKEGFFLPTGAMLMRREVVEKAGRFDEDLRMFEDIDMWLRMVHFPIAFVPQSLLARREHGTNAGTQRLVRTDDLRRLFEKHNLAQRGVPLRATMRRAYYLEGRHYLERGDKAAARRALGRSLRMGIRPKALALYCGTFGGGANLVRPQTAGGRA